MSPVAQPDLADDVFDLDLELLVDIEAVQPIYACSIATSTMPANSPSGG
ncbi:hypothetical protein [Nonomuraea basaltis]|nr:hypothetical protein [Nonomuraea basaltis]